MTNATWANLAVEYRDLAGVMRSMADKLNCDNPKRAAKAREVACLCERVAAVAERVILAPVGGDKGQLRFRMSASAGGARR